MDWALLLVFLLCPLMMMFMHGGHKGHNHSNNSGPNHVHGHHEHGKSSSEVETLNKYKIKQLEGENEFLKTQNDWLQKEVENFTGSISQKE